MRGQTSIVRDRPGPRIKCARPSPASCTHDPVSNVRGPARHVLAADIIPQPRFARPGINFSRPGITCAQLCTCTGPGIMCTGAGPDTSRKKARLFVRFLSDIHERRKT